MIKVAHSLFRRMNAYVFSDVYLDLLKRICTPKLKFEIKRLREKLTC